MILFPIKERDDDFHVQQITNFLTGNFDSADQANADPQNFFEIRIISVPIWPQETDGKWLYVEQAAFSSLDKPYRQRLQHIHRGPEGELLSELYLLPGDPLRYAGAWKNPDTFLSELSRDECILREGCTVTLQPDQGGYIGTTTGQGCESRLGGADYATSEVQLSEGLLISWDRGWNLSGEQVWGSEAGGYHFVRKPDFPQR